MQRNLHALGLATLVTLAMIVAASPASALSGTRKGTYALSNGTSTMVMSGSPDAGLVGFHNDGPGTVSLNVYVGGAIVSSTPIAAGNTSAAYYPPGARVVAADDASDGLTSKGKWAYTCRKKGRARGAFDLRHHFTADLIENAFRTGRLTVNNRSSSTMLLHRTLAGTTTTIAIPGGTSWTITLLAGSSASVEGPVIAGAFGDWSFSW